MAAENIKLSEGQLAALDGLLKLSVLFTLVTAILLNSLLIIASSDSSPTPAAAESVSYMVMSFICFVQTTMLSSTMKIRVNKLFRFTMIFCAIVLAIGCFLLVLSLHTLFIIVLGINNSYKLLPICLLFLISLGSYVFFLVAASLKQEIVMM
jgi:hypothetical protein